MLSVANSDMLPYKQFEALGDELRLNLLCELLRRPATASELALHFQYSQSFIWKCLESLRRAGFVRRGARRGQTGLAYYDVVNPEQVRALIAQAISYTRENTAQSNDAPGS